MLLLHLLVAVAMGLLVGLIFYQLDDTNIGVQNRLGSMFFAVALFGFSSLTIVDSLVLERELLVRETSARYYGSPAYLAAKLVMDGLLLRTLPAVLFTALMYPLVGLVPEPSRVVTFMFVLATYAATVGALAVALAAACRSTAATTLGMNLALLMWVLVGGYLVNPSSIPVWLRWVRYLSPMSYAFEVMASNEMADQLYAIKVDGFPSIGGVKGEVFLRTLGLQPGRSLENVAALVGFYYGSVLLAFVVTWVSLRRRGGSGRWGGLCKGGQGGGKGLAAAEGL
jgi:ABC-type multidrug transport system permease subunit